MKSTRKQLMALRNQSNTKDDRRTAMADIMRKTDDQINNLLDSKQQEFYKQYKAERSEQMKQRIKGQRSEAEEEGIF